jgi:glycosyltransferase involved in cell wall biosynthesis
MKIAIVIATYQRPDGRTPYYLERTLTSIDQQIFQDFHVYVIGDAYVNEAEMKYLVGRHPKTSCYNLDHSPERERYGSGNMNIWHTGGNTAANIGIELALADKYEWVCHLAHDDVWLPNHLALINNVIEDKHPIFICTMATYAGPQRYLPDNIQETHEIISFYPIPCGIVASATCVRYSKTKLRVTDRLQVDGVPYPSDAYLWMCLEKEMKETGQSGYIICTITCQHDEEGYAIREKRMLRK